LNATSIFRDNNLAVQVFANGAFRPVKLEVVNNIAGVRIFGNSSFFMDSASSVYIAGNANTGLSLGNMSSAIINSGLVIENNGIGISCSGTIDVNDLVSPTVVNNTTVDFANCD